jgi:hypothetical protein
LPWKNACWQQLLVFGCQWVPTTPLHLLSIWFMHIGSPNTIQFRVIWSNQNKCQTMALKLQALLNKFGLKENVYSCQKWKPTKFLKVRRISKVIMNCESSRLEEPFQSACLGM